MLDITIKIERPRVEELFAPYRTLIGHDFDGYRNHVYRCITYAMHFLDNAAEYEQMVETAFVYHDIGLWTDQELAYLEPSEAVALRDNDKPPLTWRAGPWDCPKTGPARNPERPARARSRRTERKTAAEAPLAGLSVAHPNLGACHAETDVNVLKRRIGVEGGSVLGLQHLRLIFRTAAPHHAILGGN